MNILLLPRFRGGRIGRTKARSAAHGMLGAFQILQSRTLGKTGRADFRGKFKEALRKLNFCVIPLIENQIASRSLKETVGQALLYKVPTVLYFKFKVSANRAPQLARHPYPSVVT